MPLLVSKIRFNPHPRRKELPNEDEVPSSSSKRNDISLSKLPEVLKDMRSIEAMIDKLGDHPTVANNSVADKPAEIITKADTVNEQSSCDGIDKGKAFVNNHVEEKIIVPEPVSEPLKSKSSRTANLPEADSKLPGIYKSVPEAISVNPKTNKIPDATEEQKEKPMTTIYCPESIPEEKMSDVRKNPEDYIEINMIKRSRVVDAFYIPVEKRKFSYKKKEFNVLDSSIYLLPTKAGVFMPTCYYHESKTEPTGFKQTNKGITGKALSLLYMEQLYTSLLYAEENKYNIFIVILSIITLIAYGIGCYFVFVHNGGLLPYSPPPSESPIKPIEAFIKQGVMQLLR